MAEKQTSNIPKEERWVVLTNSLRVKLVKCFLRLKVTHEILVISSRQCVKKILFVGDSKMFIINGKIKTIFKLSLKMTLLKKIQKSCDKKLIIYSSAL